MRSMNPKIKKLKLASKLLFFFPPLENLFLFFPFPNPLMMLELCVWSLKHFSNFLQILCSYSLAAALQDCLFITRETQRKALRRELVGKCYNTNSKTPRATIQPHVKSVTECGLTREQGCAVDSLPIVLPRYLLAPHRHLSPPV